MYVKELWRYPVKSLGGERVEECLIGELGLTSDRLVLVHRSGGRIITSRTHPQLLALKSSLGEDGQPRINGIQWTAVEALDLIRAAVGPAATLLHWEGPERFDVLPLSVATDGAIQHMQFDGRRLRPNIIIGGVEGLAERTWPGRNLKIGSLLIHAQRLRPRCVMTTWDPDTQEQDISVLKRIARELEGVIHSTALSSLRVSSASEMRSRWLKHSIDQTDIVRALIRNRLDVS
jgi:hypothetical protein